MARMLEVKFGDLQVDERYKKLVRDLKLTLLRKENKQPSESVPSSLPHTSNININPTYSSTSTLIEHISRTDNDFVSSSKNLRNMLPKNKSWRQNDCTEDSLIMQAPDSYVVPRTSKKLKNTLMHNGKSLPLSENKYISSYIEFNRRKPSFMPFDINKQYNNVSSIQSDSDNVQSKRATIFMKWKVMLTEQGQLVIKGVSQCKQIVQSKPVIRRLTSTSVESVCKDLYHLEGNIVDDEHELPEYVRGKFYNGFPDDWENVWQIWRTFVQQDCRVSFRWPTRIADSDDDLKSEVTDVTYLYSQDPNHEISDLGSPKRRQTPRMLLPSDNSFDVSQNQNDKTFSVQNYKKRNSCTQTSICGITENLFYNIDTQKSLNQHACSVEYDKKQESMKLEYSTDKDKLASKLNVILNNLLNKNCPKKCITEIIEIVECLNYVMSHKTVDDNESSMEDCRNEQGKNISSDSEKLESTSLVKDAEYNKNVCDNSIDKYTARKENIVSNNITDRDKSLPRKRTFIEMNKNTDNDSFESEEEIYSGVPKIPAELLLRRRGKLTIPYKRKVKKVVHQDCNVTSKQCISNVSSPKNCIDKASSKQTNNIHFNDSDVTKSDKCFSKTRNRVIYSNISNESSKSVDYNIDKEEQGCGLNNLDKGKNTHKVQKCFRQENSTLIQRSGNSFHDSFDRMKNREFKSTPAENYMVTEKNSNARSALEEEDRMREANSDMETVNESNDQLQNYAHCKPSNKEFLYELKNDVTKPVKPAIISSVPVNIKISSRKSRASTIRNENNNFKELNKENKNNNSTQNVSSRKFHTPKNANSTLLSNSKKNIEKHVQLDGVDSTSSKILTEANLDTFKSNQQQDTNYCKPKLLTAWVPKVSGESLIFEGTLLNDAGHIMRKKFQTDSVVHRVSPKLIETVHHEFYQLVGDLNDTKHVVPSQLKSKCRYGCPSRIEQFCKTWKLLQNNNDGDSTDFTENSTTVIGDPINVGVSSKGRRIIRPLSYWTGERISLKGDNTVYDPGTLQESFDQNKSVKTIKASGSNNIMYSSSDELEVPEKTANKTPNNTKRIASSKSKNLLTKHKRRTDAQTQESNYSSDSENFFPPKKYRVKATEQTRLNPVGVTTVQDAHSTGIQNSYESYARHDETKSVNQATKTNENTRLSSSKRMSINQELSDEKYHNVVCTYFRDIPFKDDMLSEDQESHV